MPGKNTIPKKQKEYHIKQLEEWKCKIGENLPHLSKPQATVLALWSSGTENSPFTIKPSYHRRWATVAR